jgi:hypothetical protein
MKENDEIAENIFNKTNLAKTIRNMENVDYCYQFFISDRPPDFKNEMEINDLLCEVEDMIIRNPNLLKIAKDQ